MYQLFLIQHITVERRFHRSHWSHCFIWRYVMIARRGFFSRRQKLKDEEKMKVDAIAKFARIIQSCRECSCGRRLRRRRLQVVTDPPVGIRPEINSHTPREKLHVSVSLSFSFSLARLFPIPFSLLLSRDPCRRFNVSLFFCIPSRLTLSLSCNFCSLWY